MAFSIFLLEDIIVLCDVSWNMIPRAILALSAYVCFSIKQLFNPLLPSLRSLFPELQNSICGCLIIDSMKIWDHIAFRYDLWRQTIS